MAEEIKETAKIQPKRNKSQEQRPKEAESSAGSLDVSVGDKDNLNDIGLDYEEMEANQKHQDGANLPLNLENLQALKSQYKSSTEITEQQ
jgi:hypothetical protein